MTSTQQWQAQIWIDRDKSEPPTILYGTTIAELKNNIKQNMLASKPQTKISTTNATYVYSDGITVFPENYDTKRIRKMSNEEGPYEEGWYGVNYGNIIPQYPEIGTLNQLIQRILKDSKIVEKGPG